MMNGYVQKAVIGLLCTMSLVACSSGSSKEDEEDTGYVDVPLGVLVDDVQIAAGKTEHRFPFDVPGSDILTDLTLDLTETLSSVTVVSPAPRSRLAQAPVNATMNVRVGSDESTVCSEGELYGPYSIEVDDETGAANSISPSSVEATQKTMNVINQGGFYVCMIIDSPQSAVLSAGSLSVESESCDQDPQDISGYWSGTYTCENTGTAPECNDEIDQPVQLMIMQEGGRAEYIDYGNEVSYSGTVCGNTFRFDGGQPGNFTEAGTFTLTGANAATKTSDWQGIGYDCRGSCSDTLSRGVLE